MNKVITINLNGVAYQLEEAGYDALRGYLENAARRLEGNPDKDEIITDIEQSIADKFRALLVAYKTVVNTKEGTGVLDEMGPVEDASAGETAAKDPAGARRPEAAAVGEHGATGEGGGVRRLYRIYPEGAMLSGVCNGLGAYFGLDPTIFRIGFVLLSFLWGTGLLAYVVLVVMIPRAKTPTEIAAAVGAATTAQEFIKRARAGYYEGMRSFHDRHEHRAWKRKFRQDMRGWKRGFRQHLHEHAHHWHGWSHCSPNWQQGAAQRPPAVFGAVFLAPFLSVLLFAGVIGMVYTIYSLATTGHILGLALPAGMPLWVGILLVVLAYQLIAWPIKSARDACYYPGAWHHGHSGPFGGFIGGLVGLFFLGLGIWSLDRHVPEFHEWIVQLPVLLHRLADTVQGWFTSKG